MKTVIITGGTRGIGRACVERFCNEGWNVAFFYLSRKDIAQEIERLQKEESRLEGELKRVNGMLANEKFISKAPAAKIEEEKAKLAKYTQMMEQIFQLSL